MLSNLFTILLISLFAFNCTKKSVSVNSCNEPPIFKCEVNSDSNKMNGVSYVAMNYGVDSSNFNSVVNVNANWVAITPFGFIPSSSSKVEYNSSFQWYGETINGTKEYILAAKQKGLKVLMKPHLWIWGTWVGDLNFSSQTEWNNFDSSYTAYILDFAKLADSLNVESFCIGVELKKIVQNKPQIFIDLIDTIKSVYSGELTYAANWDNYKNVTFWDKLDYIGIDAYFPVSNNQTPSVQSCFEGWDVSFTEIKNLSNSTGKQVCFTEYGYRNIDYTGLEPWDDNSNSTFNTEAQNNAYQALYCKFWNESWFKGGFLWKWYPIHSSAGGESNNRFTPQNKPAEEIIKSTYGKTK